MTRLVARIRILPAEADSDLEDVVQRLKTLIPDGIQMMAHAKEPIAFGLEAIVGDFLMEDQKYSGCWRDRCDKHKQTICKNEVQVLRRSSKLKFEKISWKK